MSDVFISYSRLDKEFVGQLRNALVAESQDVWIDWEDIPPSRSWWDEIKKGIEGTNNFIIVLSPHSVASPVCHMEIEYARTLKKRIIPVLHHWYERDAAIAALRTRLAKPEEVTTRDLWQTRDAERLFDANDGELRHINFFIFQQDADFHARFADLLLIIRSDYAHKELHTMLLLRAQEWENKGESPGYLMSDEEIVQAEAWLENADKNSKEPPATHLHRRYIAESRERADMDKARLRNLRRASVFASFISVVALVLTILSVFAASNAEGLRRKALEEQAIANDFANAILNVSETQESIERLNAIVAENPDRAYVYRLRGIFYAENGNYDAAFADYDRALALDPDYVAVYVDRGVDYGEMGRHEEAIASYTQALERDPEYTIAYYNRGRSHTNLGDFEAAAADFTSAIALDPDNALAYRERGTARYLLGDHEAAVADYTQAAALDPADAETLNNRCYVLNTELGRAQEALEDCNRALELRPGDPYYLDSRCKAKFNVGDYAGTVADCTAALEQVDTSDPLWAGSFRTRADAYYEQGEAFYEQAIADYRQYEALTGQLEDYMAARIDEMEAALAAQ